MYKNRREKNNNKTRADLDCRSPGIQNNVVPTLANTLTHPPTPFNTAPRNANCLASLKSDAISIYSHAGGFSSS